MGSTSSSDPAQVFLREQLRNALDLRRSCSHELLDIVQVRRHMHTARQSLALVAVERASGFGMLCGRIGQ